MSGLPRVEEIRSVSRIRPLGRHGHLRGGDRHLLGPRPRLEPGSSRPARAIPEGYGEPEMGPISTGLGEIFQFEVQGRAGWTTPDGTARRSSTGRSPSSCEDVPGVVEVNTFGGELKTYEVQVDPETAAQLRHRDGPGLRGPAEEQRQRGRRLHRPLRRAADRPRPGADPESLDERRRRRPGEPARTARRSTSATWPRSASPRCSARGPSPATAAARPSSASCMMLIGENARVVADRVKAEIERIEPSLPPGVTIEVFYDRTDLVGRTITTVVEEPLEGGRAGHRRALPAAGQPPGRAGGGRRPSRCRCSSP